MRMYVNENVVREYVRKVDATEGKWYSSDRVQKTINFGAARPDVSVVYQTRTSTRGKIDLSCLPSPLSKTGRKSMAPNRTV